MSEAQQHTTIEFELVSPEEKLVSEAVHMAVIPGTEGEMGVGAQHASFVVALKPGVVKLYKKGLSDDPRKIFIAGGFADVTGENCTVLAEQAVNLDDLDQKELESRAADLTEDLGLAAEETDKMRIQRKLDLVRAQLRALSHA